MSIFNVLVGFFTFNKVLHFRIPIDGYILCAFCYFKRKKTPLSKEKRCPYNNYVKNGSYLPHHYDGMKPTSV